MNKGAILKKNKEIKQKRISQKKKMKLKKKQDMGKTWNVVQCNKERNGK